MITCQKPVDIKGPLVPMGGRFSNQNALSMSEKIVANLAEKKVGDHFDFDSEDEGEQLKR